MIYQPNKINILEGDWVDQTWWSKDTDPSSVFSRLLSAGFQILKESTLPFNRLYDQMFWGSFRSVHRTFLAKVDFRHWYADEEDFQNYVRNISSIPFSAVAIAESPFGYERPLQIQPDFFEKKMYERLRFLATAIKNRHPKTKIVSPRICVVEPEFRESYLEFFIHNRDLFDIYSLDCAYDMSEMNTAVLTSFLSEVLRVLPKEVWITRWAVPASDQLLKSEFVMTPSWKPIGTTEASLRLRSVFDSIETITGGKSKWFYSGCGKDDYHPSLKVCEPLWQRCPHIVAKWTGGWNHSHVMGLVTHENEVKEPILSMLIDLHDRYK